jgi:hypothetical protein
MSAIETDTYLNQTSEQRDASDEEQVQCRAQSDSGRDTEYAASVMEWMDRWKMDGRRWKMEGGRWKKMEEDGRRWKKMEDGDQEEEKEPGW